MKSSEHKDLGRVSLEVIWEGESNKIVLVKSRKKINFDDLDCLHRSWRRQRGYQDKEYFYCLWGSREKPIAEMAVVPCFTPTGKPQRLRPAMKRFNLMVKYAPNLIMT